MKTANSVATILQKFIYVALGKGQLAVFRFRFKLGLVFIIRMRRKVTLYILAVTNIHMHTPQML